MRYVSQKTDDDCGVAVLAMITGRTLVQAYKWLKYDGHALKPHEMEIALMRDGRFIRRAHMPSDLGYHYWPPKPFADAHYVMVTATKGGHWVAMDDVGNVLDPWDRDRKTLLHPAYSAIHQIVGITICR